MSVRDLTPGLYLLRIENGQNTGQVKLMVK